MVIHSQHFEEDNDVQPALQAHDPSGALMRPLPQEGEMLPVPSRGKRPRRQAAVGASAEGSIFEPSLGEITRGQEDPKTGMLASPAEVHPAGSLRNLAWNLSETRALPENRSRTNVFHMSAGRNPALIFARFWGKGWLAAQYAHAVVECKTVTGPVLS